VRTPFQTVVVTGGRTLSAPSPGSLDQRDRVASKPDGVSGGPGRDRMWTDDMMGRTSRFVKTIELSD